MSWRDAGALAAKSLRGRPGRAVLTILAVALASALLTALLTISTTAETRVLSQLSTGGPLAGINVAAAQPDPTQIDVDEARPGKPKALDARALATIERLPDVRAVVPVVSSRVSVLTSAPTRSGKRLGAFFETAIGVDLRRAGELPISLLAGRLPTPGSTSEVAVTQGYVERFGYDRATASRVLGTTIELAAPRLVVSGGLTWFQGRWAKVVVVGVVADDAGDGQFLGSATLVGQARSWSLGGEDHGAFLAAQTDGVLSPYTGVFVVAKGLDNVAKVRLEITAVGYSTSAPENLIASVRRYLRVVEIVLSAIGLIALVVAALGISNAMLAAVRERRREIGVLKAIGARDRDVSRVFLVEAGTLGLVGGVLGTAVGWAIAVAVGRVVDRYLAQQHLAGVQISLPPTVVVGTVVGATVLALLAGLVPARRAARLPAREAVAGV